MELYIFTVFIIGFFALFEVLHSNNKNFEKPIKIMYGIVYFILVLQMGTRWETGTDWPPYFNQFADFQHHNGFVLFNIKKYFDNEFEWGYNIFAQIIAKLFNSYSFFLFIHALIYYFFIFKGFKKLSPFFLITILLFYSNTLGLLGSNRQLLALSIGLFATKYIFEKKYMIYVLLILFSSLFHTTSLLMLFFVFLNREIKPRHYILAIVVCFIIGNTQLPLRIFGLMGGLSENAAIKSSIYLDKAMEDLKNANLSVFGLLKRIIIIMFFFLSRKKLSAQHSKFNFIFNVYVLGLAYYFLFSKTLIIMISRGSLYFAVMEPLLLTYIFLLFTNKVQKSFIWLFILLFSILNMNQSISSYKDLFDPYKGIFINEDYHRIMH